VSSVYICFGERDFVCWMPQTTFSDAALPVLVCGTYIRQSAVRGSAPLIRRRECEYMPGANLERRHGAVFRRILTCGRKSVKLNALVIDDRELSAKAEKGSILGYCRLLWMQ